MESINIIYADEIAKICEGLGESESKYFKKVDEQIKLEIE